MKYRIVICLVLGMALAQQAQATDKKNNYLILGPGALTCHKIVTDLAEDAKHNNPASVIVYSNWLAGNLTSYNRTAKNTYSILGDTSFTEAFQYVVEYCQHHPDAIYASAVDMLIEDLRDDRYETLPAPAKPHSKMPQEDSEDSDK